MVFAPTHNDFGVERTEPATAPRRLDHLEPPTQDQHVRLRWRAVVHAADRETVRLSWHLAACSSPLEPEGHCPEGRRLLEATGDPDGHCLVGGERCERCQSSG